MQLRVARLCLDCEEVHVESRCPRCASESYAFLSTWLPTEERRRWRKPLIEGANGESRLGVFSRMIARFFGIEPAPIQGPTPARRRSDAVPNLTFEEPVTENRVHEAPPKTANHTAPSSPRT